MSTALLTSSIASKLMGRLLAGQTTAGTTRNPLRPDDIERGAAEFLGGLAEDRRLASSEAIRAALDEQTLDSPRVATFAGNLHRHYQGLDPEGWPVTEVFAQAAQAQWTAVVADIAGRWLHDWALSSEYQVSSSSALAVRLLRAHQRVGAAASRLEADLIADGDHLGIRHQPTRVTFGLGDPHGGLQTVARVDFPERTLIYRPHRPVSGDLISTICSLLGIPQPPAAWDRGDHSWSEFLQEDKEAADPGEFYEAVGQWTALGYILNGVDFHNENFILEGSIPRLIDLETLFRPVMQGADSGNELRWADSVLAVGTLPFKIGNGPDSIEVGLVRAHPAEGAKHPFPAPVVRTLPDGTRTFEMQETIPADRENTVFLEEQPASLQEAKDRITGSFAATLRRAAENQEAIRELILNSCDYFRTRVIATPTYRYAQVQATAAHPAIADDPYLFALSCAQIGIWGDEALWKDEWHQLMNDDIPAFAVAMDSRDLVRLDGNPLANPPSRTVIAVSPLDHVLQKLGELNDVECVIRDQSHWIDAAFIGRYPDNRIRLGIGSNTQTPVAEMLATVVTEILDRAGQNAEAHFGVDFLGATVGEDFDRNWQVMVSDDDFYGGSAGVLYFLATYFKFTADQQVRPLLEQALTSFYRALVKHPLDGKKVGGLATGNTGLLLAAVTCGHALEWEGVDRAHYVEVARQALATLVTQLENSRLVPDETLNLDAINGLASQFRGFVEITGMLPELAKDSDKLSRLVRTFTESWLLRNDVAPDDGGFAHSTAGILDAYVASGRFSGIAVNLELVEHQIHAVLNAALKTHEPSQGWCHGMAGLGALAINLIHVEETKRLGIVLLKAIRPYLLEDVSHMGMSACHGYAGVLEVLYYLGYFAQDRQLEEQVREIVADVLVPDLTGDGLTKEHYSVSLFCGLAGLGQVLLSLVGYHTAVVLAPWH